jgi:capsid protein
VDPYKEILAQLKALEGGLSDYASIYAEQGEDYEEKFAQQERELNDRKRRGLPIVGAASTAQPDPLAIQPDPPAPPGS